MKAKELIADLKRMHKDTEIELIVSRSFAFLRTKETKRIITFFERNRKN